MKNKIVFVVGLLWCLHGMGQLSFCPGNSGDPIFIEDFGSGTTDGPALSTSVTSYTYGFTNGALQDGNYIISSYTPYYPSWFDTTDHTPDDVNGKAFIVNASHTAGEFYKREVSGLCENTSYEFSAWLLNIMSTNTACANGGIPINVKFQIWDGTDTQLLAEGDTGAIPSTNTPQWREQGLVFQTEPGQTTVILKMLNNGSGGCGNDLAIDDITFKTCGDYTEVTNAAGEYSMVSCDTAVPLTVSLSANPDNSVYQTHVFQWQESLDGVAWVDVPGETNATYTPPPLVDSRFFRVKVAEDVVNIANGSCNSVSEVFDVLVDTTPNPPQSNGDVSRCEGQPTPLTVITDSNTAVNWYANVSGGTPLATGTSFNPATPGTYYAEAVSNLGSCPSFSRTAVRLSENPYPVVQDEVAYICEGGTLSLSAETGYATYLWSTGENGPTIEVDAPGVYTVAVGSSAGCTTTKTIEVIQRIRPIISDIRSEGTSVRVEVETPGEFVYRLDGGPPQQNPVFENLEGGRYVILVEEMNGCGIDSKAYVHLVIPQFFTPNGDTVHDYFQPKGLEFLENPSMRIFDRYGKLLVDFSGVSNEFSWNGTYNGSPMPASDYWYVIQADSLLRKGHVALKR